MINHIVSKLEIFGVRVHGSNISSIWESYLMSLKLNCLIFKIESKNNLCMCMRNKKILHAEYRHPVVVCCMLLSTPFHFNIIKLLSAIIHGEQKGQPVDFILKFDLFNT